MEVDTVPRPLSTRVRRNVRAELARADHSYRDAAAALGLSYATFRRRILTGDFRPDELEALAVMLEVPLARLTEEPRP
jgi:ABC-type sulfate transport system permease component